MVMSVRPEMSLFGANAAAVPANPTVVVSNTSDLPLVGTTLSAQFPALLHELLTAPVQCSTVGVAAATLVRVTALAE